MDFMDNLQTVNIAPRTLRSAASFSADAGANAEKVLQFPYK